MDDKPKTRKVIVFVVVGVVLFLLLLVSYFGVLSPARMLSDSSLYYGGYAQGSEVAVKVTHREFENAESTIRQTIQDTNGRVYRESKEEYDSVRTARFVVDVPESATETFLSRVRETGEVTRFSYNKVAASSNYAPEGLLPGYERISVTLREEKSALAALSGLDANAFGRTFSGSIVALLYFIVAVLPWALVILGIYVLIKYIKYRINGE